jgi:hypothetical protein
MKSIVPPPAASSRTNPYASRNFLRVFWRSMM